MVLLAMGLPILVWLVVVAAVVQLDFHGGSWFCLLAIVNFWAIFKLTSPRHQILFGSFCLPRW